MMTSAEWTNSTANFGVSLLDAEPFLRREMSWTVRAVDVRKMENEYKITAKRPHMLAVSYVLPSMRAPPACYRFTAI